MRKLAFISPSYFKDLSILRDNVDSLAIFFVVDHDTIFFTMILNRVLEQKNDKGVGSAILLKTIFC